MLSLRSSRRLCHSAADSSLIRLHSNSKPLEPPLLDKLKAERDPDKLFHLFKANANNRLLIENRLAFDDTVSRLAGARRFDYIEHLLEHQKTLPHARREGFIVRIITLYGKAGMTNHAIDTFYHMHCRRTVKSFNAALKVLALSRNFHSILDFLTQVPPRFDIQLDTFSVNIVIKAFCDLRKLQEAYLFMLESEKKGVQPDVVTYTTLLSAFYNDKRWEIGNGLWNRMVLKGCMPNIATFNVRIQFLVSMRRAWDANELMDLMRRVGIAPDQVTFNLVIKGFCQAGYLDIAKRVLSSLQGMGYEPNAKVHQTMIHYLCKSGDFDLAYTMCKYSMGRNWFPNVDTICMLLEGLKGNGQIQKGINILSTARKRVPPFSSNHLASMQSILSVESRYNEHHYSDSEAVWSTSVHTPLAKREPGLRRQHIQEEQCYGLRGNKAKISSQYKCVVGKIKSRRNHLLSQAPTTIPLHSGKFFAYLAFCSYKILEMLHLWLKKDFILIRIADHLN
ncbi:hypothetical protein VNO77_29393 [Canavalia gladiata]|uniref:Pentatricopeptide repeat domain 1 n=1 Tax=Canavalia gladiata TaxID=3824 RepID=A0AAN9Q892_CANGL